MTQANQEYRLRIQVGPSKFGPRSLAIYRKDGTDISPLLITRKKFPSIDLPLAEQTIVISDARLKRDISMQQGATFRLTFENGEWVLDRTKLRNCAFSPGTHASRPIEFSIVKTDSAPPRR